VFGIRELLLLPPPSAFARAGFVQVRERGKLTGRVAYLLDQSNIL
jgi:hypothetical protein